MNLAYYLDVKSADGNMAEKLANNCLYFVNGTARFAINRYWPTLREEW